MGQRHIHETIIRDILDVVDDVKNSDEIKGFRNRSGSFKSIANASKNLTCVFPVIAGTGQSIEADIIVSKAIERKAVSMLQILFTASSITSNKDGLDYLKKFHNNLQIDDSITVDSLIDSLDRYVIQKESMSEVDKQTYFAISEDVKRNLNYFLPDIVSEHGLEECEIYKDRIIMQQAETPDYTQREIDRIMREAEFSSTRAAKDISDITKNRTELFNKQVIPSDIKKANELVPTMMVVNFVVCDDDTDVIETQMVIGVKAKLYLVDDMDIINRIKLKYQDKNSLLKFVKASTREISFFRDFMFAIDKAKLDALSQSKKGSSNPMWKVLERRSTKSKIRRVLGQTNDASAITTLTVTQEMVQYLIKEENINLADPKTARGIMDSYNFMCIVIVDESTETAKFIFDTGDDMYETLSFDSLERESNDNSKKIINLMSKMAR